MKKRHITAHGALKSTKRKKKAHKSFIFQDILSAISLRLSTVHLIAMNKNCLCYITFMLEKTNKQGNKETTGYTYVPAKLVIKPYCVMIEHMIKLTLLSLIQHNNE